MRLGIIARDASSMNAARHLPSIPGDYLSPRGITTTTLPTKPQPVSLPDVLTFRFTPLTECLHHLCAFPPAGSRAYVVPQQEWSQNRLGFEAPTLLTIPHLWHALRRSLTHARIWFSTH